MVAHLNENLTQAEAPYRSLYELSPIAIYLLDGDGNFLSVNPAGEQLLGASAQEIVGTNIISTYPPGELSSLPLEKLGSGLSRFERSFLIAGLK